MCLLHWCVLGCLLWCVCVCWVACFGVFALCLLQWCVLGCLFWCVCVGVLAVFFLSVLALAGVLRHFMHSSIPLCLSSPVRRVFLRVDHVRSSSYYHYHNSSWLLLCCCLLCCLFCCVVCRLPAGRKGGHVGSQDEKRTLRDLGSCSGCWNSYMWCLNLQPRPFAFSTKAVSRSYELCCDSCLSCKVYGVLSRVAACRPDPEKLTLLKASFWDGGCRGGAAWGFIAEWLVEAQA